jgi:hypothetical protein
MSILSRLLAASAAGVIVLAGASTAFAAPSAPSAAQLAGDRWGYVWANQPAAASYTPSTLYQRNSTGALNTITRSGTGAYVVHFTNLGPFGPPTGGGGMVQVSAYGSGTTTCKVSFWFANGSSLDASVRCFTPNGVAADSLFTASFTGTLNNPGDFGFVWANQPSATAPYTPSLLYQFNSKGRTNTVTRVTPGRYAVLMPGLGGGQVGGTVLVTGYSSDNTNCIVSDWFSNGPDLDVDVQCRNLAGAQVDGFFTVTYARSTSMLGVVGAPAGYVLNTQPTNPAYVPPATHQFNSTGGVNTVTRAAVGNYTVHLPGLNQDNGHVQVTASGFAQERCRVNFWFATATGLDVNVLCFGPTGAPLDSRFTMNFVR